MQFGNRYYLWDPVRRDMRLIVEVPLEHNGRTDSEASTTIALRARREYEESIQQVHAVHAHIVGDTLAVTIATRASIPGTATRSYDLALCIELPDLANETDISSGSVYSPFCTERVTLGPASTIIERHYAVADFQRLLRPMCGVSRIVQMPVWYTHLEYTLRPVPIADDAAHGLPRGIVDGLAQWSDEMIEIPLRAEWFHGRTPWILTRPLRGVSAARRTRP